MSEEQKPDTVEAVSKALDAFDLEGPALMGGGDYAHWPDRKKDAEIAIAAHNEDQARQGYAVVKIGSVPPWMERWGALEDGGRYLGRPCEAIKPTDLQLYRLRSIEVQS